MCSTCNQPDGAFWYGTSVVGIAGTSDGGGYWIVNNLGQIAACGDAPFDGQPGPELSSPVVGIAATPDGGGYWVTNAAGGVYNFGDGEPRGTGRPTEQTHRGDGR